MPFGMPVTVSIGLEYKFELFTRESFVRVDDEYQGRPKWASAGQDATTLQYDPANYTLSSTNFATGCFAMWFLLESAFTTVRTSFKRSFSPFSGTCDWAGPVQIFAAGSFAWRTIWP